MERGISKATENELIVNAARFHVESHFGGGGQHQLSHHQQRQRRQLPLAPSPESAAEYSSHEDAVSADTPDRKAVSVEVGGELQQLHSVLSYFELTRHMRSTHWDAGSRNLIFTFFVEYAES